MKPYAAALAFLGMTAFASAVPDPRDSIILESKTIAPSNAPAATTVRVSITNKDTLYSIVLALEEKSLSGGAYMVLAYPRTFDGILTPLTATLQDLTIANTTRYHGDSPDSFLTAGFFDPLDIPNTAEPPNSTRKPFYEIKFDTVRTLELGTVAFDSCRVNNQGCYFVNQVAADVFVNFLFSTITVAPKGDLDANGFLTPADAVVLMNCIFRGITPLPGEAACDLNCDGEKGAADVVLLINAAFNGEAFPC